MDNIQVLGPKILKTLQRCVLKSTGKPFTGLNTLGIKRDSTSATKV